MRRGEVGSVCFETYICLCVRAREVDWTREEQREREINVTLLHADWSRILVCPSDRCFIYILLYNKLNILATTINLFPLCLSLYLPILTCNFYPLLTSCVSLTRFPNNTSIFLSLFLFHMCSKSIAFVPFLQSLLLLYLILLQISLSSFSFKPPSVIANPYNTTNYE